MPESQALSVLHKAYRNRQFRVCRVSVTVCDALLRAFFLIFFLP